MKNVINSFIATVLEWCNEKRRQKLRIIEEYRVLLEKAEYISERINSLKINPMYINHDIKTRWKEETVTLQRELLEKLPKKYKHTEKELLYLRLLTFNIENFDNICESNNETFIANELVEYENFFNNIEGSSLDIQQRTCIVKDEINSLVIAGAGSGKTKTIIGKVKYVLSRYRISADEILVLSFTTATAEEMKERLYKETNEKIEVRTFHSLGKDIISKAKGKAIAKTNIELEKVINNVIDDFSLEPKFMKLVNVYFLEYFKEQKEDSEFETLADYYDYLRDKNIKTFKNESVKSFEEMEIANFLYRNNISYIYEEKYKYPTQNIDYGPYRPDFYLPDHDIYIEHFGIDRNGNVPKFFSGSKGETATEKYNKGIMWKRETHKERGTTMIETYSYEKKEGVLFVNLQKSLENLGVQFFPMSDHELFEKIKSNHICNFVGFKNLIGTFLNYAKANDISFDEIRKKNEKHFNTFHRARNLYFIQIVEPIFLKYESMLKAENEIDFNDMINKATKKVKKGEYRSPYRYIIVDEYQDISFARFSLINSLKDQTNAKLFCVGDDWQSIYRFTGSAIQLFSKLEKYVGYTEKSYIETTYRFNKNIIRIGEDFITKNPSQLPKKLKPKDPDDNTPACTILPGDTKEELQQQLISALTKLPVGAKVLFLGRYLRDYQSFVTDELKFTPVKNKSNNVDRYTVTLSLRSDLNIEFMTIHKSKGLESEFVFVLNNTNLKLGFPSQIEDDPVMQLLHDNEENFEYGEERRLFYVALTRAKKHIYLVADTKNKSLFLREIEARYKLATHKNDTEYKYCPVCKKGIVTLKIGQTVNGRKRSNYYSCSNIKYCKYFIYE